MEDILASIRRILNEDETAGGDAGPRLPDAAAPELAPPATPERAPPATLERPPAAVPARAAPPTTSPVAPPTVQALAPFAPPSAPPAPVEDDVFDLTADMMLSPPPPPPPVPAPAPSPPPADALIGAAAASAAAAALGQLARAVASERSATVHRGGPSIEEVVREELRPMLSAWLDSHLPPLVERLVRAEIERVVGRALP